MSKGLTRKDKGQMRERINKQKRDNNNIIIQITLFDVEGKYKPVSTLIEVESVAWYKEHEKECRQKAIQKICLQRNWTGKELLNYGYKRIKVRNYTLWKEIQKREGKTK